jgi:hypothetical protein
VCSPGNTTTIVVARTSRKVLCFYNDLTSSNFGQLCSLQLDGQVYAQPLVVTNVMWAPTGKPYDRVVYVVTESDTIYAIDGTPPTPGPCTSIQIIGSQNLSSLLPGGQYPADCKYIGNESCTTIAPYIGVLGTPVVAINPSYLITETQDMPRLSNLSIGTTISTLLISQHSPRERAVQLESTLSCLQTRASGRRSMFSAPVCLSLPGTCTLPSQ